MGAHTIHQRRTLDQSNYTLRFNRSMEEAGIYGQVSDLRGRQRHTRIAVALYAAGLACIVVPVVSTIVALVR